MDKNLKRLHSLIWVKSNQTLSSVKIKGKMYYVKKTCEDYLETYEVCESRDPIHIFTAYKSLLEPAVTYKLYNKNVLDIKHMVEEITGVTGAVKEVFITKDEEQQVITQLEKELAKVATFEGCQNDYQCSCIKVATDPADDDSCALPIISYSKFDKEEFLDQYADRPDIMNFITNYLADYE